MLLVSFYQHCEHPVRFRSMPRQQAVNTPIPPQTVSMAQPICAWSNWRHALNQAPPFLSRLLRPFIPRSLFIWRKTDSLLRWSPENPYPIVKPNMFISSLHHYITTLSCSHIYPRVIEITSQTSPLPIITGVDERPLNRAREIEQHSCAQRHLNDASERIASGNCGTVVYHYRALMEEYVRVTLEVLNEDPEYEFLDQGMITWGTMDHSLFKYCGQSDCLPQALLLPPPPLPPSLSNSFGMPENASSSLDQPTSVEITNAKHPTTHAIFSHNGVSSFPRWFSKIRHSSVLFSRIPPRRRVHIRGASEPPSQPLSSLVAHHSSPTTQPTRDSQPPGKPSSPRVVEGNAPMSPIATVKDRAPPTPHCGWPDTDLHDQRCAAKEALSSPMPNLAVASVGVLPNLRPSTLNQNYFALPQHAEDISITTHKEGVAVQNGGNSAFAPKHSPADPAKMPTTKIGGKYSSFSCSHLHERQCIIPKSAKRARSPMRTTGDQGDDELSSSRPSPPPNRPAPPHDRKGKFNARRDPQVNASVKTIVWIQQCTEDMERFGPNYFEDPNQSPVNGRRISINFQGEPVATTHLAFESGPSISRQPARRCQ